MQPDPIATLVQVSQVLDRLGIPDCVGGSLASSFYGIPRATNDVDLIVDLRLEHAAPLVAALEDAFMIDLQAVTAAIASGRSFNVIEDATLDKVDLFVVAEQPLPRQLSPTEWVEPGGLPVLGREPSVRGSVMSKKTCASPKSSTTERDGPRCDISPGTTCQSSGRSARRVTQSSETQTRENPGTVVPGLN